MSTVRRLKPKRVINKPAPMKLGSKIHCGQTRMNDIQVLKRVLSGLVKSIPTSGIIKAGERESVAVDMKLGEHIGFRTKGSSFEFISAGNATAQEKSLIRKIGFHYNIHKAIKILEENHYKVEADITENGASVVGTLEEESQPSIDIRTDVGPTETSVSGDESETKLVIHSKNFENSENCRRAVDLIANAIEGEKDDYEDTNEYASPRVSKRQKEREKIQVHRTVVHGQERKSQNRES